MLNTEERESLSYKIGILLPGLGIMLAILYEIVVNPSNKSLAIVRSTCLLFMYFNIGIREIVINKSRFGYLIILSVVAILILSYR